jgi:hypothetical protein
MRKGEEMTEKEKNQIYELYEEIEVAGKDIGLAICKKNGKYELEAGKKFYYYNKFSEVIEKLNEIKTAT